MMRSDGPKLTSSVLRGLVIMSNQADHRHSHAMQHLSIRELDEWFAANSWLFGTIDHKDRVRDVRKRDKETGRTIFEMDKGE